LEKLALGLPYGSEFGSIGCPVGEFGCPIEVDQSAVTTLTDISFSETVRFTRENQETCGVTGPNCEN